MKKALIYSFLNFPFAELVEYPIDFKFHKLNKDFVEFICLINSKKPDLIIGLAKSSNRKSRFETKAVNVFSKRKFIDKKGLEKYTLSFPTNGYMNISVNEKYTDSFCNWTIYKISQHLEGKDINLQFIHIAKNDIQDLNSYLESL